MDTRNLERSGLKPVKLHELLNLTEKNSELVNVTGVLSQGSLPVSLFHHHKIHEKIRAAVC